MIKMLPLNRVFPRRLFGARVWLLLVLSAGVFTVKAQAGWVWVDAHYVTVYHAAYAESTWVEATTVYGPGTDVWVPEIIFHTDIWIEHIHHEPTGDNDGGWEEFLVHDDSWFEFTGHYEHVDDPGTLIPGHYEWTWHGESSETVWVPGDWKWVDDEEP